MASDDVVSRVVPMEGTLRYLFDSYDADHDGWLTPANFALFLWDLKRCVARTRDRRLPFGIWPHACARAPPTSPRLRVCSGQHAAAAPGAR